MKVAISVPDPLFKAADDLAGQLRKSRSELYSDAVAAYIGSHGANAVREQMNAVCDKVDTSPDPVMTALAMRTIDSDETW
jgi:metal-responsive CopG/Arc/MetJ family transcriptional regulator